MVGTILNADDAMAYTIIDIFCNFKLIATLYEKYHKFLFSDIININIDTEKI